MVVILLTTAALGLAIWLVVAWARRSRKFRAESAVPPFARHSAEVGVPASNKGELLPHSQTEPASESSNVSTPETGSHKEQAGKSIEKLAENPSVTLLGAPAPAPLPGELADSWQTHQDSNQPSQPGSLAEGSSGENVPQQISQSEERDLTDSLDSRGLCEGALTTTNPQEPKTPATQPASGADDKTDASRESEKKGVVPERLTYRPPSINPPRNQPGARVQPRAVQREQPSGQPLEVNIQAVFDRHGFCQIRMLGQRLSDSAEEVEVRSGRETFVLSAYGDAWYEIDAGEKLATLLGDGFQFSTREPGGAQLSWRLSVRDVYVLAGRHGLAGSVLTTWLRMGRDDQVVLCKTSRVQEVMAVLEQAGCGQLEAQGEDYGAPAGWSFFRRVKPL